MTEKDKKEYFELWLRIEQKIDYGTEIYNCVFDRINVVGGTRHLKRGDAFEAGRYVKAGVN